MEFEKLKDSRTLFSSNQLSDLFTEIIPKASFNIYDAKVSGEESLEIEKKVSIWENFESLFLSEAETTFD